MAVRGGVEARVERFRKCVRYTTSVVVVCACCVVWRAGRSLQTQTQTEPNEVTGSIATAILLSARTNVVCKYGSSPSFDQYFHFALFTQIIFSISFSVRLSSPIDDDAARPLHNAN